VTVCDFSSLASCYAEPNGWVRPGAAIFNRGYILKKILLAILLMLSGSAHSQQRPGFIPIPAGQQIILKLDVHDVPRGPLTVPFTKGWSFRSQGPVFAGLAPDGQLKFEATFAYDPKAMRAQQAQEKFAADNRRRLPAFQTQFVSEFGKIVKPCIEQPQPDGRFRFICTATRQRDGKNEYLIAYAYVGKWAILFLNFYDQRDSTAGFDHVEDILKNARWEDALDSPAK
jgi:hypothetical protein